MGKLKVKLTAAFVFLNFYGILMIYNVIGTVILRIMLLLSLQIPMISAFVNQSSAGMLPKFNASLTVGQFLMPSPD